MGWLLVDRILLVIVCMCAVSACVICKESCSSSSVGGGGGGAAIVVGMVGWLSGWARTWYARRSVRSGMPCCMAVKGGCCASTVAMCVLFGVAVGLAALLLLGSSLRWHVCLAGALALLLAAAGLAVPWVLAVVGCAVVGIAVVAAAGPGRAGLLVLVGAVPVFA